MDYFKEFNQWIRGLTVEGVENLPEKEILSRLLPRPGHPGSYGFIFDCKNKGSDKHIAEIAHALLSRVSKIEKLEEKMKYVALERKKNLYRAQMELMGCYEWEINAALARIDAEEKQKEDRA